MFHMVDLGTRNATIINLTYYNYARQLPFLFILQYTGYNRTYHTSLATARYTPINLNHGNHGPHRTARIFDPTGHTGHTTQIECRMKA